MPVLAAAASWESSPRSCLYLVICRSVMRWPGTVATSSERQTTVEPDRSAHPGNAASTAHDSCRRPLRIIVARQPDSPWGTPACSKSHSEAFSRLGVVAADDGHAVQRGGEALPPQHGLRIARPQHHESPPAHSRPPIHCRCLAGGAGGRGTSCASTPTRAAMIKGLVAWRRSSTLPPGPGLPPLARQKVYVTSTPPCGDVLRRARGLLPASPSSRVTPPIVVTLQCSSIRWLQVSVRSVL